LNHNFKKWEILEVIVVGLNTEFRGYVKFVYHEGFLRLLSRTQGEIWNFFEKLPRNAYECEHIGEILGYPTRSQYAFHVNPHH